MPEDMLPESS
ncbi:helix-turn-helix family protein, partial [Vibrio cholerae O1 str. 116063]